MRQKDDSFLKEAKILSVHIYRTKSKDSFWCNFYPYTENNPKSMTVGNALIESPIQAKFPQEAYEKFKQMVKIMRPKQT